MKTVKTVKVVSLSVLFILTMLFSIGFAQEEGEEGGIQYTQDQTCVEVRSGVQLTLKYDKGSAAFIGIVKNISRETARRVRVEVHLSNGIELGPTTPVDLAPGKEVPVKLEAKNQTFKTWSTHAEVGSGEAGHGEEGERGEHAEGRERGEHGGEHGERGEHEGEEGGEGHEEGEGHEGGEGEGDGRSGAITPLGKRFKGIIDEFEVNMFYDAKTMSITGTIKNISSKKVFSVQTEHHLKLGTRTVAEMETTKIGDLNPGEVRKTTATIREKDRSRLISGTFDGYVIHIEVLGPKGGEGREGKSIK